MATIYWNFSNSAWTSTDPGYTNSQRLAYWSGTSDADANAGVIAYRVRYDTSAHKMYLDYRLRARNSGITETRTGWICSGAGYYGGSDWALRIRRYTDSSTFTNIVNYSPTSVTGIASDTTLAKLPRLQQNTSWQYNTASSDGTTVLVPWSVDVTSYRGVQITGYIKLAWYRKYVVSGSSYNEFYQLVPKGNLGLCTLPQCQWTVAFNANGGSGSMSSQTKYAGDNLTLSSNSFTGASCTVTFNANGGSTTKSSQTASKAFNGWNTAANGSGTAYANNASYTANAGTTLYAQWNSSYSSVTLPTATQCTRSGWTLLGFSTSSTATAADSGLTPGASYTPTGNKTLYAVWRCTLKIYYHVNNGSITTGTGTTRYRAGSDGLVERSTDSGSTWADYYSTMYNYDTVKDLVNVATFGITRTGYYITGTTAWRTSGGTIISQESTSASDTNAATIARMTGSSSLSGDTSITLYVNWTSYKLTIKYNTNGGSITTGTGTTRYRSNSGVVQVSSDSGSTWADLTNTLTNDSDYINLYNVGTYGATKTGYYITGTRAYRTAASSGNSINQDTASASDTNAATMANLTGNAVLTANTTITLYAYWQSYKLNIQYNVNGGSITTGTGTTRYRVNSDGLVEISSDSGSTWSICTHSLTNDSAYVNLGNIETYGAYKTGYQYEPTEAYSSAATGGTKFNQDTTSTSDVNPTTMYRLTGNNTLTANTTIILYMNWQIKPIGIWIYDGSSWHLYNQYVFNGVEWNSCIPAIYSGSVWDYTSQTT